MKSIKDLQLNVNFHQSIKIGLTLSFNLIPILYLFSSENLAWIILANLLWFLGTVLSFYPFVMWIYPHLMSKTSVYLLNLILILFSSSLGLMSLGLFLDFSNLSHTLLNFALLDIIILSTLYMILVNTIIANTILIPSIDFYKEESLF